MFSNPLRIFNLAAFCRTQLFLLPVLLLFYQDNGLSTADFFLFQGIYSITALLLEIPAGYIGDLFPRKYVLIFAYSCYLGRLCLWILFGGYTIVLMGEILYAISKAFSDSISSSYIYDYLKTQNKEGKMLKRYGKLNFFMSVGTAFASLTGAYFYSVFGSTTLLVIEFIFNSMAVLLLSQLPNIPSAKKAMGSFKEKYKDLFNIIKRTLKNEQLRWFILYSALMNGTTYLFVWGFQPLMKHAMFPVSLFGVVFFINHSTRALASAFVHKTLSVIPLKKLGISAYIMYIFSFLSALVILRTTSVPMGMFLLTFICITIAMQLSFTLGNISRINTFVSSDVRSSVSSVNMLISRLMASGMLISFKFVLDKTSMQTSYLTYLIVFLLVSFYPLRKIQQAKMSYRHR